MCEAGAVWLRARSHPPFAQLPRCILRRAPLRVARSRQIMPG